MMRCVLSMSCWVASVVRVSIEEVDVGLVVDMGTLARVPKPHRECVAVRWVSSIDANI